MVELKSEEKQGGDKLGVWVGKLENTCLHLAEDLHRDNLISADTLFTVTRNLDQLMDLLVAVTNKNANHLEYAKQCALIEHKVEIIRLNFINASNNFERSQTHSA